jgi:hypothetical protein
MRPLPAPAPMQPAWRSFVELLRGLETHPHVQRLNLQVDYADAWQVGYTLLQLLPLDEAVKYHLLGLDSVDGLMDELDGILNRISEGN